MKKIYTIGFTKKTAQEFFSLLDEHKVTKLVDVRLNNTSQLAAFSKFPDIAFFLEKILGITYYHDAEFAPTADILQRYKKKEIDWTQYETEFNRLMEKRDIFKHIKHEYPTVDGLCLLCSEPLPDKCHRRLAAELFAKVYQPEIVQL